MVQPSPPDANDGLRANALGFESMSQFRHECSRLFGLEKVKEPEAEPSGHANGPSSGIAFQETD